jgi:hypothetical protein
MTQTDKQMKLHAGVLAAFAADALALGVHWVYDAARFFALPALETAGGADPVAALRSAAGQLPSGSAVTDLVAKGLASADKQTSQAISDFGQACDTTDALPGGM